MRKSFPIIVLTFLLAPFLHAQSSKNNSFSKLEDKILDTISSLKEVAERSKYVENKTNGKRHLQYVIWEKPGNATPYYWVKVVEDNGSTFYTHFNFYVYPNTMMVKYYDTINGLPIDLTTWRKNKKC
jgi:hypothetical protein